MFPYYFLPMTPRRILLTLLGTVVGISFTASSLSYQKVAFASSQTGEINVVETVEKNQPTLIVVRLN